MTDVDVVSLSTERRDLDKIAAARVAEAMARQLAPPLEPGPVDLKIDSAFRGNPRHELLATMAASRERRALVAPAFPMKGGRSEAVSS